MKAILVNPAERRFTEIDLENASDIAKTIGCSCITLACGMGGLDYCYVDDEGLLKDVTDFFRFSEVPRFKGPTRWLAGKGLIVNDNGEDVKVKIEDLEGITSFRNAEDASGPPPVGVTSFDSVDDMFRAMWGDEEFERIKREAENLPDEEEEE